MNKLGQGQKIIFFHGGGVRYNCYLPLIKQLSRDYSVYYFNLPGHGGFKTDGNPQSSIDTIVELIQKENIEAPILLGHSYGGYVAYELAFRLKNVKKVLLIDPLLTQSKFKKGSLFYRFFVLKNVRAILFDIRILKFFLQASFDLLLNVLYHKLNTFDSIRLLINSAYCNKTIFDGSFKLSIIHGDEDSIIPLNELNKQYENFINIVNGEHDWCMNDVKHTYKEILKYI